MSLALRFVHGATSGPDFDPTLMRRKLVAAIETPIGTSPWAMPTYTPPPPEWVCTLPVANPFPVDPRLYPSPFLAPLSGEEQERACVVMEGDWLGLPLTREDLDVRCLRPGRRLSQTIVDLFFTKLGEFCRPYEGWHFADSNLFAHLHNSSPPGRGACKSLARLVLRHEFVVMPCCLSDHWILVLIRNGAAGGRPLVHLLNSVPGLEQGALVGTLRAALGTPVLNLQGWPITPWAFARIPCQRQAPESVDCGVHLLYNAVSLALRFVHGAASGPDFDPALMRSRAAAAIAAEIGTPPWITPSGGGPSLR